MNHSLITVIVILSFHWDSLRFIEMHWIVKTCQYHAKNKLEATLALKFMEMMKSCYRMIHKMRAERRTVQIFHKINNYKVYLSWFLFVGSIYKQIISVFCKIHRWIIQLIIKEIQSLLMRKGSNQFQLTWFGFFSLSNDGIIYL